MADFFNWKKKKRPRRDSRIWYVPSVNSEGDYA